jgi:urocanate hydratase
LATADQYRDNYKWILGAQDYQLVVGSQARILYADQAGRSAIAVAINRAVAEKKLKSPVVISRDHHDVSGTDSPFRETSDIYDGSALTADMAVQNCIGDACRGATWVALHNGGTRG